MKNNKGFTLVELLAMLVMLGLVMMAVIPNIAGISEANKKQAYAEDALRFKNTVEYMIRSGDDYIRPTSPNGCVVVSLTHLVVNAGKGFTISPADVISSYAEVDMNGTDYDSPPYDGLYDPELSYVVVYKNASNKYEYYVQLLENVPDANYRGVKLSNYLDLEGSGYLSRVVDVSSVPKIFYDSGFNTTGDVKDKIKNDDGANLCNEVDGYYFANALVLASNDKVIF